MNAQIEKLYKISQKESRLIIGLMSGTSLDGLDVALCKFTGHGKSTNVELMQFSTVPYDEAIKTEIRKVFAKQNIDFPLLCMLNPWVGKLHGKIINDCLNQWSVSSNEIDLIASHGQTVMHQPKRLHGNPSYPNSTLQIGDADHLAVETNIITISDFRQKHCAVGGEGAPLALYGDYLLFSSEIENRVLINIGGIANFTYLPSDSNFNSVFATDTGPGNTIIDAYVQKYYGIPFDENAAIAESGEVDLSLLKELKTHPYFQEAIPKTTGPELFNLVYLERCLSVIDHEVSSKNVLASLCHFTAETLVDCIKTNVSINKKTGIYLSGGGMHNPLIVKLIKQNIPKVRIEPMHILGVSGDAKEAILFATLANETIAGKEGFAKPNKSQEQFFMGKISLSK